MRLRIGATTENGNGFVAVIPSLISGSRVNLIPPCIDPKVAHNYLPSSDSFIRAFVFCILVPKGFLYTSSDETLKVYRKCLKKHEVKPHRETSVKVKVRCVRHCIGRDTME